MIDIFANFASTVVELLSTGITTFVEAVANVFNAGK